MIGYTRKVGLRKPDLECTDCWLRAIPCEHPDLAWGQIRALRRHQAHGNQPDPGCPCNWPGEPGAHKVPVFPRRFPPDTVVYEDDTQEDQ